MNKILYLEKISLTKKIIGNLLWLSGLFSLLLINIKFGPGFLVLWAALIIGGLIMISTNGIELDFQENQYRTVSSFLGSNYGLWKSFPRIDYLSLFKTTVTQTVGGRGFRSTATATLSDKMIVINLFNTDGKPTTLYMTKNAKIATEIAEKVRIHFGVEVVNKLDE